MLLSKTVKVKSSKYYKDLGYDIDERYIEIDIKDLPKGSNSIIESSCDYCDNIKEISYKNYNKNISINGKFSCSIKCGCLKSKETNLEKYGVESINQLESKKEKSKNTIKERYGVSHISKLDSVRKRKSVKMKECGDLVSNRVKDYRKSLTKDEIDKINKKRVDTNLEKYGKENVSQIDETKMKVKKSFIDKYGGFTFDSDFLMNKVNETNLEKYGFINPSKNINVKNKMFLTNIEKWGYKSPSMNVLIKDKIKNTMLYKYDVVNIMNSVEFRKKFNISNELNFIKYIGYRNYEFFCTECSTNYEIDYDNYYKRSLRFTNTCTNCFPIMENSSIKEIEVRSFIQSIYDGEIISSYRDGLEIDIYIPDLSLGFEFNGIYWHSDEKIDKNYHRNKLDYFKERNIKVMNIWEDDWDFKRNIVKSQIINSLFKSEKKVYARKCNLRILNDVDLVRDFLNDNHIQGYIRSSIKIGLFLENELISIMTFDNLEGRKKMEDGGWNLSRFCSKRNYSIIGGASKLLKYFINTYSPIRIISFADLDWSTGELYNKLGFKLVNTLDPDYKYIVDRKRVNKQRFTKRKLEKMGYDSRLTERQIVESIGIKKIYNCGQLKFEIITKQSE